MTNPREQLKKGRIFLIGKTGENVPIGHTVAQNRNHMGGKGYGPQR